MAAFLIGAMATAAAASLGCAGARVINNDDGTQYVQAQGAWWLKTPSGYLQRLPSEPVLP